MPRHTRLHRRNGTYYLRVAVPQELREAIGKREIWKSLGTSDPKEANSLVKSESLKVDQLFEAARKRLRGEDDQISDTEAARIAAIWLSAVLEEDEEIRREGLDERDYRKYAEALDVVDVGGGYSLATGDASHLEFEIDEALSQHGLTTPKGSPSYRRLAYAMLKASAQATEMMRARHAGKVVETPSPSIVPTRGITLGELIDRYMEAPERSNLSGKTKDGYKVIFRLLREALGENRMIRLITRDDCRALQRTLTNLPPNATKRFPGLSLEEVTKLAQLQGLTPMKATSINSYLNNLASLFNWAVQEDLLDKNPATGLSVPDTRKAKDRKKSFSTDQLRAIFNAPLYTGCVDDGEGYAKAGPNKPRRGRFWVPLLSLFSGMRLNECCQLLTSDVRSIDGVDCILIHEDPEGGDEADKKRVKTDAGERYVPIHPELAKLGFIVFVAEQRRAKQSRLFPELTLGANGYYSDPFSKWYSRFLKSAGAYTTKTTFHSFRHCYRDAMREAGLPRDVVLALGGWEGGSVDDDYGSGFRASTLYQQIEKIAYPGLDLSHLHRD
ncbi:DUF6538 domain-containing protein [Azospirillum soli]|uniref:DUF6538 domain-containing protein n=1 Tax=Azospirillum soli TaxID=1304799 RepID=UPI001AE9415B|nr:DUF6538 domain-containing protein [Azospirillum soli]MBP2312982.1 integrase [Azospirillum soli]